MSLGFSRGENGTVVLEMTQYDYDSLLIMLGVALGTSQGVNLPYRLALINRINVGNPRYTAYELRPRDLE